jgi:hypothetical protein
VRGGVTSKLVCIAEPLLCGSAPKTCPGQLNPYVLIEVNAVDVDVEIPRGEPGVDAELKKLERS